MRCLLFLPQVSKADAPRSAFLVPLFRQTQGRYGNHFYRTMAGGIFEQPLSYTGCMAGIVLDGKAYAKELEAELAARVQRLNLKDPPILATILVGEDPASATYVRMKGNACRRVGMESLSVALPGTTTTQELLAKIDELNAHPRVRGILLQHPVPK